MTNPSKQYAAFMFCVCRGGGGVSFIVSVSRDWDWNSELPFGKLCQNSNHATSCRALLKGCNSWRGPAVGLDTLTFAADVPIHGRDNWMT